MALTMSTAARNAACDATVDLLDGGAADPSGDLVIMAAGDIEVATLVLSNPAFGAAVAGVSSASAIADDTNATGGIASLFRMQNRDNVEIFRGTVTGVGGGGDIEASSVNIGAGDTVSISGTPTFTAPAS